MKPFVAVVGRTTYFFIKPFVRRLISGSTRTRVLVLYDDQLLLLKQTLSSGAWLLPGGGVKSGESLAEAALRELKEEIGIVFSEQDLQFTNKLPPTSPSRQYEIVCCIVKLETQPVIKIGFPELYDYKWVPLNQLGSLNLSNSTVAVLQANSSLLN